MKKILMLGTGGTIASEITESGLSPQLTTEQILHYCPDISGFCSVDCLQLCNLDSTNIAPEHWQRMADSIRKEYNHYDGFVLTHGTDTMAYTAAALSYLPGGCLPLRRQRGCPRGFYRIQWPGDPRDPRTQNTLQELSGVFQHQLP